jgi:hypothetical protein
MNPPSADDPRPLQIKWSPVGKQMKVTLRVFDNDALIETETVDLANPTKRQKFAEKISAATCASVAEIADELLAISVERSKQDEPPQPPPPDDDLAERTRHALEQTPPEVLADAEALLAAPDLIARISADIEAAGVAGEED